MVKYKVIQDPAVDDNEVLTLVNTEDNTEQINLEKQNKIRIFTT